MIMPVSAVASSVLVMLPFLCHGTQPITSLDMPPPQKRLFLSRGWGPGGFNIPSSRKGLYTKAFNGPKAQALTGSVMGGPHQIRQKNSAKSSVNEVEPKPYRRFHSIFTSGTWSPLGKRDGGIVVKPSNNQFVPQKVLENSSPQEYYTDGIDLQAIDHPMGNIMPDLQKHLWHLVAQIDNDYGRVSKRTAVFSSRGWGAGGMPSPHKLAFGPVYKTYPSGYGGTNWPLKGHIPNENYVNVQATDEEDLNNYGMENDPKAAVSGLGMKYPNKASLFWMPQLHLFTSRGWQPSG